MNKRFRKIAATFLALVMCFSILSLSAFAENTGTTVWYGDQLAVDVTAGTEGYTFMSLFRKPASGYEFGGHFLANSTTQEGAQTFVVLDTIAYDNTTWTPSGRYVPYQSNYEVTYCCDIGTMMSDGAYYKRLNLEDSEYFSDAQAAKIRSVVTNSYPYVSLEEMKADLAAGGFENADKLTRGEILAAVQTAIWACANDMEPLKYVKSYRVTDNYQWGQPLHDISDEAGLDVTGSRNFKTYPEVGARIDSLVEYLLAQTAVYADKAQIVITELKIVGEPAVLDQSNHTYRVLLSLIMNNSGSGYEDNINIHVTVGEDEIIIPVVYGQESYSLEVIAKPGDEIKAVVSGTQVLPEGVYFYSPKAADINGDGVATSREVSQNMVGVAMGKTPVYAEDSVSFEELTIYEPVHTQGSIVVTTEATGATTPASTTFQLQKQEGNEWINVGEAVAYSAFIDNTYTFNELEEGTYKVVESGAEVDGYTLETSYSADAVLSKTTANNGDTSVSNGAISVTNKYTEIYVPVHTLGSITVSKTTTGATTPADAIFQLQKLDGETWTNVGEAVAYSAFIDNTYTFNELEEGTYRVVESDAEIDGFTLTTSYSENVVLTKTTANNGDTSVNSGEFSVTNAYVVIEEDPTEPEETEPEETEPEDIIEIPEEDVPLASAPVEEEPEEIIEIPEEDVPLAPAPEEEEQEDLVEIPDELPPLADVPKTGDLTLLYSGMAAASGVVAICVRMTGKKNRKQKEDEE